jgi:hypothetical protein
LPPSAKMLSPGTATEMGKLSKLEGPALERLKPEHSAYELAELLLNEPEEFFGAQAMHLLGHSLERREVVWWALHCVKAVPELVADKAAQETLAAAEAWFENFADNQRRIAFDQAQIFGPDKPASMPGIAAFFCEGSLTPATVEQEIKPDPQLVFGMGITTTIISALAGDAEPEKATERFKSFLALAKDIAEKKNRWKEAPPSKPSSQPTPTATRPSVAAAPGANPSSPASPAAPVAPPVKPPPPPPKKGYY